MEAGFSSIEELLACLLLWLPKPTIGNSNFHIRLCVPEPNQILSSEGCKGTGSDISLLWRPSFHRCLIISSMVGRPSDMISLWSKLTPISASEWWPKQSDLIFPTHSIYILLEHSRTQSTRWTSLNSSWMSRMLMPSVPALGGSVQSWQRTVVGYSRLAHLNSF